MNPPVSPLARLFTMFLCVLGALCLLVCCCVATAGLWVASSLRLSGDARALRDSLRDSTPARWNKRIEVNVGWLTVKAAKEGLRFARLDPEARTALEALSSGQVGVYEMRGLRDGFNPASVLSAADRAMANRGWERLVGVVQPETTVVIYVQPGLSPRSALAVCFAVLEREQLVVGSASGDLEPLLDLASREIARHGHGHAQRPGRVGPFLETARHRSPDRRPNSGAQLAISN